MIMLAFVFFAVKKMMNERVLKLKEVYKEIELKGGMLVKMNKAMDEYGLLAQKVKPNFNYQKLTEDLYNFLNLIETEEQEGFTQRVSSHLKKLDEDWNLNYIAQEVTDSFYRNPDDYYLLILSKLLKTVMSI
jgi:hypothetical protein